MKELIKQFLKENNYHKGQIYKVCPDVLLNKFLEYKHKEEDKISLKSKIKN